MKIPPLKIDFIKTVQNVTRSLHSTLTPQENTQFEAENLKMNAIRIEGTDLLGARSGPNHFS